jgi:hypothetical protein
MCRRSVVGALVVILMFSPLSVDWAQKIQLSPDFGLYFGQIPQGTEAVRDLLIYNLDIKTLTVNSVQIEGADAGLFSLVEDPGSFSLGPLELRVVPFRFRPTRSGDATARVKVVSNASSSPNYVDLTGKGIDLSPGQVAFERILGNPDGDGAAAVRPTREGGLIVAGYTHTLGAEYSDGMLLKVDNYGQVEWMRQYGEEGWSEGFSAVLVLEDGFLAVGSKSHSEQRLEPDMYVVRTDTAGNLLWEKRFGRSEFERDVASDVVRAHGGGFIVAGSSQSGQNDDALLVKIDEGGNELWRKVFGGDGGDGVSSIVATPDGGYLFVGSTSSYSVGGRNDYDIYMVKLDGNGNQQWMRTYGGSDWDQASHVALAHDGGYIIAGWTASSEYGAVARDVLLVKTDPQGDKQWHRIYGWEHKDGASAVIPTSDGGYLLVGDSERYYDAGMRTWRSDLYIVKLDAEGQEEWTRLYGRNNGEDGASDVYELGDGSYIVCGSTDSYSKTSDVYLLRLNRWGEVATGIVMDRGRQIPVSVQLTQNYPNPFNSETTIQYDLPRQCWVQLEVLDLRGRRVETLVSAVRPAGVHHLRWQPAGLPSGIYLCRLSADGQTLVQRMVYLR